MVTSAIGDHVIADSDFRLSPFRLSPFDSMDRYFAQGEPLAPSASHERMREGYRSSPLRPACARARRLGLARRDARRWYVCVRVRRVCRSENAYRRTRRFEAGA